MNRKQLKLLYKKEIMDVLRDKKTVFVMIVLPLILYPLLFLGIMQVMVLINSSQQEQTYHIAYENVDSADRDTLNKWIRGTDDKLDYSIEEVQSGNPGKDLEQEKIDAYITTSKKEGQVIYEVHYLSAVTDSANVSDMLEEEIKALSEYQAEKAADKAGLNVAKTLHPYVASLKDQSSNESALGSILGGIIPFLLITSILMGCMYPAIDATAGEKERGTLETLLTLPIGNLELIMSKFLSVATIAVVSVFVNVLSIVGVAIYLYATIQSLAESTASIRLGGFIPAILISVVCVIVFALLMSAVVMCICAFAKSFKEANNYVTPLTLIVMLTGYIGFIPNVELSYKTALIPVVNICLLMKELLVFKYEWSLIALVLLSNIVYAFIAVWMLAKVYDSETILFGESMEGIKLFERRKNLEKGGIPSVAEAMLVWIVAMLLMVYLGGIMSLSQPLMGVILPQLFIGVLPLLACLYIKADKKRVFGWKRPGIRNLVGSVILWIGAGSLVLLLSNGLAYLLPDNSDSLNQSYAELLSGVPFVGALFLIALLPAVCEEIMFRGYLFAACRKKMSLWKAMLVVSVLFGISHMSLIKFVPTALLGLALVYARYRADSLAASSVMHFLNNAFSVFLIYYGDKVPLLKDEHMGAGPVVGMLIAGIAATIIGIVILRADKSKTVSSKTE